MFDLFQNTDGEKIKVEISQSEENQNHLVNRWSIQYILFGEIETGQVKNSVHAIPGRDNPHIPVNQDYNRVTFSFPEIVAVGGHQHELCCQMLPLKSIDSVKVSVCSFVHQYRWWIRIGHRLWLSWIIRVRGILYCCCNMTRIDFSFYPATLV